MGQRVVFEFLEDTGVSVEHWSRVNGLLKDVGAKLLAEPSGSPPHTLVAILPDGIAAPDFISRLGSLAGVGRADVDAWRQGV